MKASKLPILFCSIATAALLGCSPADKKDMRSGGDGNSTGKLKVTTTTTMITDLVQQVGGDLVEVQGLMGPGVDPHLYQRSDSDIDKLKDADVIFYHGLHLEAQLARTFETYESTRKHVYRVTKQIPNDKLLQSGEAVDPHIWFDVLLWAVCIDEVVTGLSAADPDNADTYQTNGDKVRTQMTALHKWALWRVNELPENQRILFTSHDAFEYFAGAYGFKVEALLGISTEDQAGGAKFTKMVDRLKASPVKVVFTEFGVNPKGLEQIRKDAGATIGGEIFSDAMGQPGKLEGPEGAQYDVGTYEGMIRHNINTIVDAILKQ